ncbi:MAG TPA: hypothetical protein VJO52_16465 [Gemmatimonadaceae bacterium]|nr:hypothetical protein [Gemmatimonadaceae bacterium]
MTDQRERGTQLFAAVAAHHNVEWTPSNSPKFGANALRLNGSIYAALTRSHRLLLKIAPARIAELLAAGHAVRFESGGRVMNGWITLAPDDAESWIALSDEARAFVATQAKQRKRTRKSGRPRPVSSPTSTTRGAGQEVESPVESPVAPRRRRR